MTFLIFLCLFVVALILYILALLSEKNNNKNVIDKPLPYYAVKSILTDAELKFYRELINYVNDKSIICPKVSLSDIFKVKNADDEYMKYLNKIKSKHVDFIICGKYSLAPLYAVELDDSSHLRQKRKERDEFVNKLYDSTGIKLIHIKVKKQYTPEDFAELIQEYYSDEALQAAAEI